MAGDTISLPISVHRRLSHLKRSGAEEWHAEPCHPIEHVHPIFASVRYRAESGHEHGDQTLFYIDGRHLRGGSPVDWVNETHAAAVSVAYGALPENADADLAGAYAETARSVVDSQLLKAGLRLAALLNAALK